MRGGCEADPECGYRCLALVSTGLHGAAASPFIDRNRLRHTQPALRQGAHIHQPSGGVLAQWPWGCDPRLVRPCPERPGSCPSFSLEPSCWAVRCLGHSARKGRLGAAAGGTGRLWYGRLGKKRALCLPGAHSGALRGTKPLLC